MILRRWINHCDIPSTLLNAAISSVLILRPAATRQEARVAAADLRTTKEGERRSTDHRGHQDHQELVIYDNCDSIAESGSADSVLQHCFRECWQFGSVCSGAKLCIPAAATTTSPVPKTGVGLQRFLYSCLGCAWVLCLVSGIFGLR